jgi:hypothetical protein
VLHESVQLFLTSMLISQYFRGEYKSALSLCEIAESILDDSNLISSQVYGCIGVSSVYLMQEVME